ncbi:hypothetical protein BCR44DRAFT_56836 [Catenaria anguillulae PL171]|uniref:Uncharacterized protein n=1 Tax=Catenaria anguillulae PL171 TaxID=765915 RepID=A0A1Y2HGF9_9FUNG|nr:hypothetical protein BCR44DRAFT_56836 [Catenaria anguillulae PL171]
MASLDDLEKAMTESLERRGILDKIQASLRAQVYSAICAPPNLLPKESKENSIINWLMLEYLQYTGLHLAGSVLNHESGTQQNQFSREEVERALGVSTRGTNSERLPLLYSLVFQHAPSPLSTFEGNSGNGTKDQDHDLTVTTTGEHSTLPSSG